MMKPILIVEHGEEPAAARFYERAFGASIVEIHRLRDGTPFSYQMRIGEQVFGVSGANPRRQADEVPTGPKSPEFLGASTCLMTLAVGDVGAIVDKAETAGATVRVRPTIAVHGGLASSIVDPFGHLWNVYEAAEMRHHENQAAA
ncbi:VOC family protein [Pararhizobium haloflavum]|uniref:VOC family protein n=1 Tax=Pararhizobium haloflavum TaxID=2037914 RepID=UPI0012FFF3EC|nr:VOC family protein [Pararhizobium haloflavum]